MKHKIQIGTGALSLASGLIFFLYFGTRERPGGGQADPETQQLALIHDLATFAGLGLLFLGVILLLTGAAKHWKATAPAPEKSLSR